MDTLYYYLSNLFLLYLYVHVKEQSISSTTVELFAKVEECTKP